MYERTSFPKTGKWARHLIRLSHTSNIKVPEELAELARVYDFDKTKLLDGFSHREHNSIQYMMDWNGRCIILTQKDVSYSRHVVCAGSRLVGSKRVLIITNNATSGSNWVKAITDTGHEDEAVDQTGKHSDVDVRDTPHKFFIIKTEDAIDPATIQSVMPDHIIVEQSNNTFDYKFHPTFLMLCREFTRVTLLNRCGAFWRRPSEYQNQATISSLVTLVSEEMGLNTHLSLVPSHIGTSPDAGNYFRQRGVRYDMPLFLEASGVSFSLVLDRISSHFMHINSNDMLLGDYGSGTSNRRNELIEKYQRHTAAQVKAHGNSLEQLVDSALAGETRAQTVLNILKTPDWAKLKASLFYNSIKESARRDEKLIIVTRDENIYKYMMLQMQAVVTSEDDTLLMSKQRNFCYPNPVHKMFNVEGEPRISNTLLVKDLTMLDEKVFETVERIVICDYSYNREDIADYIALSKAYRFILLFGSMRGTFEEILSEKLLSPHY